MAEDSPQNSSGYQERSEGPNPDVNAGEQMGNSAEDSAVAQGSQGNRTRTNNKKYDLGVLFVHGIGKQESGDTFSAIYPSIRDEFNSDSYLKYREISRSFSRHSNGPTEAVGEIYYGNIVKSVIFRESNWNKKYSSPVNMASKRTNLVLAKELIVNKVGRTHIGASLIGRIRLALNIALNAANCFLLLLYFLGMKIISSRIYNFIFSLSAVFLFLFLGEQLNLIFSNFQKLA